MHTLTDEQHNARDMARIAWAAYMIVARRRDQLGDSTDGADFNRYLRAKSAASLAAHRCILRTTAANRFLPDGKSWLDINPAAPARPLGCNRATAFTATRPNMR